jgi:arginase family enzyme
MLSLKRKDCSARFGVVRIHRGRDVSLAAPRLRQESNGCYLHFDLDVLDPNEAVANQWTPRGGTMLDEVLKAVESIRDQLPVKGFGFGSYDPSADRDGRALRAAIAITESLLPDPQ